MSPAPIQPTASQLQLVRAAELSAVEIGKLAGVRTDVVARWARVERVVLPVHDEHRHRVDQHFFDAWSHEMAYVLGFIAADGNVQRRSDTNGSLEIGLSSRDHDLLVAIRNVMKIHRPLRRRTQRGFETSTLAVGSIRIVDRLAELGIHPRKSSTLTWPDEEPGEFACSFVLGYFDGDGSIDVATTNNHGHRYKRLRMRFTGTYEFLERAAEVIEIRCGWLGNLSSDIRSPNVWTLSYSGRGAEAVAEWMYSCATPGLHLERKRSIHREYVENGEWRELRAGRLSFDDAEAIRAALRDGTATRKELAERYGVTTANIYAIVKGKSLTQRRMVRI